jgi:hypothetical protein
MKPLIYLFLLISFSLYSQEKLTLEQAYQFAKENNLQMKKRKIRCNKRTKQSL